MPKFVVEFHKVLVYTKTIEAEDLEDAEEVASEVLDTETFDYEPELTDYEVFEIYPVSN
jgi:hypothetical protein